MRFPILAGMALLLVPGLALADSPGVARLSGAIAPRTKTVLPPAGHPGHFEPAPVPDVGGPAVDPAGRAGNADDAGPINATPMASDQSQGLGTATSAPAARPVDPTGNAVPEPHGD